MIDYFTEMVDLTKDGEAQGFLFFISVYFLLFLTYSLIVQLRVRSWPYAKGKLLSRELSKTVGGKSIHKPNYRNKVLYEYEVGGKIYNGKKISAWYLSSNSTGLLEHQYSKVEQLQNGMIKVFHNPKNHKKSVLVKPGVFGMVMTIILALGPMIMYLHKFHS